MESITIKVSKMKTILIVLGALMFVALSIKMICDPQSLVSFRYRNPERIWLTGVIALLFFGLCLIIGFRTLFGNRRLVIDTAGIYNNAHIYSVEFIPWRDVKGIRQAKVGSNKFILIDIRDPKNYISNATGFFRTRLLKMNQKYYKTPIIISCHILKCNVDELEKNIIMRLEEWHSANLL